ncbi:hypothetical protein D3C85_1764620 [compost metagenome]
MNTLRFKPLTVEDRKGDMLRFASAGEFLFGAVFRGTCSNARGFRICIRVDGEWVHADYHTEAWAVRMLKKYLGGVW